MPRHCRSSPANCDDGRVETLHHPRQQSGLRRARRPRDRASLIASAPSARISACTTTRPRGAVRWHLPLSHALESWSDLRAFDGTASIVQPLIRPLYDTRTAHDVLALLAGDARVVAYDIVRADLAGAGARRRLRDLVAASAARRRDRRHRRRNRSPSQQPHLPRCRTRRGTSTADARARTRSVGVGRPLSPTMHGCRNARSR